jgi:sodium/proline symporter
MVFFWKYIVRPMGGIWDIYELLPAFLAASAAIVVVSLLTAPPDEAVRNQFDQVAGMQASHKK